MRPDDEDRTALHDAAIVERIASGDEEALALAYDRYAGTLFGSVVRLSGDREAAAEIVQDVFLALWQKAAQFDDRSGSLLGWLLAIARNRAIDRFRAESRRPTAFAVGLDERPAGQLSGPPSSDPVSVVDGRWLQSVMRTFVSELADAEREVVVLAYSAGLSQSEISGRTGLPLGTVKSRMRRAMAMLRARLSAVPELLEAVGASDATVRGSSAVSDRQG